MPGLTLLAAAAAVCALATPQACSNTNQLIHDEAVESELRRLTLGRSAAFLYGREAPVLEQLLEVLGGPPEKPVKVGPYRLFAACRAHSCDEKGALLVGEGGEIAGAAILYTGCGAGDGPFCGASDRRLAIFAAGPLPSQAHRDLLQWGMDVSGPNGLVRISVDRIASMKPMPTIDFDGDGRADRVVVDTDGGLSRLIAYRAGAPDRGVVIAHVRNTGEFFVRVLPPGIYATACGRGLGPDDAPCPADSVALARPTIGYGTAEASLFAAEWDGRKFAITALSD